MTLRQYYDSIVSELGSERQENGFQALVGLVDRIVNAEKIFVAGLGRSGNMIKSFAMRLAHLGFSTWVVGETVTPAMGRMDLLIIGSGSGQTTSLASIADRAREAGGTVALITANPQPTIGKAVDLTVYISASTPKLGFEGDSIMPGASLFELSMMLMLEAAILKLMELTGEDKRSIHARHANLE